ncbi:MAG: hypothetical protein BWY56_02410 [Acidobacteria bacterium ADurb.Bin340]|nr:MAG: hypothetical protein BWY56_02410 [Acidobacteria bacterium ADurb.Bin340]
MSWYCTRPPSNDTEFLSLQGFARYVTSLQNMQEAPEGVPLSRNAPLLGFPHENPGPVEQAAPPRAAHGPLGPGPGGRVRPAGLPRAPAHPGLASPQAALRPAGPLRDHPEGPHQPLHPFGHRGRPPHPGPGRRNPAGLAAAPCELAAPLAVRPHPAFQGPGTRRAPGAAGGRTGWLPQHPGNRGPLRGPTRRAPQRPPHRTGDPAPPHRQGPP